MRAGGRIVCSVAVLVFAAWTVDVRAQTGAPSPTPTPTPASLERKFFKNILKDQKAIWTSPVHVHADDAIWLVPLGVATGGLIATDRRTGDAMARHDGPLNASRIISYAGALYSTATVAGSFYLVGRATNNYRARETGLLSAEALIDSVIVSSALKGITQRARPRDGKDRSRFFVGGSSFPSGHSIHAWSVATVIANEYHDHLAIQIAAYGIAGAVSVSRFTGQKHYLSDILVGSALGYGIGRYVYHAHHRGAAISGGGPEDESDRRGRRWPEIVPHYNGHAHEYGAILAWSF